MIVDTHLHVVDRARLTYPWLSGAGELNRDSLFAEYAREARRAGITRCLHMEVDVAKADIAAETAFAKDLAQETGALIEGCIAACRPESEDFALYLETVENDSFVKGLRRILHTVDDDLSTGALFRDNIRRLSDSRLTFDIVMFPHQLARGAALVDSAPGVRFVLDHCGNPPIGGGEAELWRRGISELARRPNVTAKISGLVNHCAGMEWTVDTLRPWVEHVIDSFGWHRVIWGSDWPVAALGGGLLPWVAATHALIAGCSEAERTALLSRNAVKLWALDG